MKIAIVDDIERDRKKLNDYITFFTKENQLIAKISEFESGETLLASNIKSYDVIFLDIYMEGINGLEVAKEIRTLNQTCLIIFITSSDSFAIESYGVRAFHYLLKPYDYERFNLVFELIDKELKGNSRYIEIKESREIRRILVNDIIYVDYYNHYVQFHCVQAVYKTYAKFSEMIEKLNDFSQFLLCSRNVMINMRRVKALEHREFIMEDSTRLLINRNQLIEHREHYYDFIFQEMEGKNNV